MSSSKYSAKDEVRFNIRISPDLHRLIVAQAATAGQSMNTFIIERLSEAVGKAEDQWLRDARAEMRHLLEEEALFEARLGTLRAKRLKILEGLAMRQGDAATASEIRRDIAEIERMSYRGQRDLPDDLKPLR